MRRKYLVGNWKMNGMVASLSELALIDGHAAQRPDIDIAIAPPATLITPAAAQVLHMGIGAQDCHFAEAGAHTGCLSATMLKEAGASFVIVGHSERRAEQHETNEEIARKAAAARAQGLGAILCVGEDLDTRKRGRACEFVCKQLAVSLPANASLEWLTIAYEPVWAIGTGETAHVSDIGDMHEAIRARLMDEVGPEAEGVRILYGGSVNGDNAASILATDHVDGALVGGSSLTAAKFVPILKAAMEL